ncbi:hypothetical protein AaE_012907 [Aphanomyces astaci]|uniref:Tc1-like transposase DDE domain-containing protein n=1 Tax=Aphanomyces astaci TaxID=112090 RepID=A0A6A4Z8M2_APHAT|nr:hypothetical protein AaE_012907 [Aphanomyces astaci]
MVFVRPLPNGTFSFISMDNYVHVDEKWFYLTKVNRRYYVYDDEEVAAVKSKHFITKVMFLAAVARPRFDPHTRRVFDGKIGVWPFVDVVAAKRKSVNRDKGTLVTVPLSVNAEVYYDTVVTKVIPAIKSKFPSSTTSSGKVIIQQDNASPHKCVTTRKLDDRGISGIEIANQPSNSPDFNVLDLGFFNSIQSLQHQKSTRSIEELVDAVQAAFYEMPVATLSKTLITLQKVMEMSIAIHGSNDYKLPHMNKDAKIADLASYNVKCDGTIYESALMHLNCRLEQEAHLEAIVNSQDEDTSGI